MEKYKGHHGLLPEAEVLGKLDGVGFPRTRTKVKKGWVRDTVKSGNLPTQVSFAYVDFDFFEPIKDALEFLDTRMPPGGRIVVDDYGFFSEAVRSWRSINSSRRRDAASRVRVAAALLAGHFCVLSKLS